MMNRENQLQQSTVQRYSAQPVEKKDQFAIDHDVK